jgi:hypothetical protein
VISKTPIFNSNLTSKFYVDGKANLKQKLIADGDLTIAKTSGLQTALDGKQTMINTDTDLTCNSLIVEKK